jgi:ATP-dependent exoDNAse (exonuclease V) beta subunit
MDLSREQREAVERVGQDVCVVAGPGAGKTRVLTERFAWLVEQQGVEASRILAITFTEKAATEIKQRLIHLFENGGRFSAKPELRESIERAWVSTIDGFCARLLREHAIAAGIAPDFGVIDPAPAGKLLRESAEEALEQLYAERPVEMRRLLEAIDLSTQDDGRNPDLAEALLQVLEAMRVSGVEHVAQAASASGLFARARDLARTAAIAPTGVDGPKLREWAVKFAALLPGPPGRGHFAAAAIKVSLGSLKKGAAREAATELKNEILPKLEAEWLAEYYADLAGLIRAALERTAALYRERKRGESLLDFNDLEADCIRLLESDAAVLAETRARFDHVLMDEMQDTNRLQWRLVNLIRTNLLVSGATTDGRASMLAGTPGGPRPPVALFAVGDVNQSIYGFRYAEPAVFEEYRRAIEASGGRVDDLRENHRSRQPILDAVGTALDGAPGIEPRRLISEKQFAPARVPAVERLVGQGEDAAEVEASMVAARIHELVETGERKFSDIAVLVRALGSLEPFERAFDRFGIPFLVSGGRTFLEAREIRDMTALVAALVNPLDEIALAGVLRSPLVGMSDEEIFRRGMDGCREDFDRLFGAMRRSSDSVSPDALLALAVDESDYAARISTRARANLEKLFGWLRREHRMQPRPLAQVLDDLETLRSTQSEAEAPPPDAGNVVRLMSIHAAKGLEFPVVFVSALQRSPDARKPVIAFSPADGLGVKWRHPVTGKGVSDPSHRRLNEERKRRETEEENRLLYVAMTRAEDRLLLTYAERDRVSAWQKAIQGIDAATYAGRVIESPPAAAAMAASGTETILDRPVVTGQYDSSAAVTDVAMFHACPQRYFLDRRLRLDTDSGRGSEGGGGIELGLAVHRILGGEGLDHPEANELADRFLSSELGARAARAGRREREYDFLFYIEDVVLRGVIDLWFEEAGELVLVDYKTDREESPAAYTLQLRIYALALERYTGRLPDRTLLYYLRSNRVVEVSLGDREEVGNVVREFQTAQDQNAFVTKPGAQCQRCPYYHAPCPAE